MSSFLILNALANLILAQSKLQSSLISEGRSDCDNAVRQSSVVSLSSLTHDQCTSLAQILETYHQTLPEQFSSTYFSQQQREAIPECVILPTSAQEVSQALQVIKDYSCHFAIKSGGHGIFAGASNAHEGITIDLHHLNGLQVSGDRSTTSVGTGRRWGDVYRELEPMDLTVVGGRDTQIGVGGFILGDE